MIILSVFLQNSQRTVYLLTHAHALSLEIRAKIAHNHFTPQITHCNRFKMYKPVSRPPLESYRKRVYLTFKYKKCLNKMCEVSPQRSDYLHTEDRSLDRNYKLGAGQRINLRLSEDKSLSRNNRFYTPDRSASSSSSSSEIDENDQLSDLQNYSRATSPERKTDNSSKRKKSSKNKEKEEKKSFITLQSSVIIVLLLIGLSIYCINGNKENNRYLDTNEKQSQNVFKILEVMEKVKNKFRNQETDIWNEISSAINEIMSRTPKVPSIILLFANETATMNCLATELADVSSGLLRDKPLYLNPEDFGDDAGKIITRLNDIAPKVVVIHDILKINAQAIKALHNICDRINPLINEVIYILTMHTNNYQLSQKKLAFVEEQITKKLSNNIDEDILSALRTRITDGAIILVKPELHLDNC